MKMNVQEFAETIAEGGCEAIDIERDIYAFMQWAEKRAMADLIAALEKIATSPCAKAIIHKYCYERDEPNPCSSCIAREALTRARGER